MFHAMQLEKYTSSARRGMILKGASWSLVRNNERPLKLFMHNPSFLQGQNMFCKLYEGTYT